MNETLELAHELLCISRKLDRDQFNDELNDHCWPLVDILNWENPIDVWTFNAALYTARR